MTQFIGWQALPDRNEAKVVILPIAYERTTTYRKRCQEGATAIINASDQYTKIFLTEAIASTKPNSDLISQTMMELISSRVSELITNGKLAIASGEKHSIAAGVVKAY